MQTKAFAAQSATTPFGPHIIDRRAPGPEDVAIEILYCGVCHSDLHTARGEWPGVQYPCVPGHEIVGTIVAVKLTGVPTEAGEPLEVTVTVEPSRPMGSTATVVEVEVLGADIRSPR